MFLNCFSCTRDDRKERIVAAGNSVRQALQELLSEYMENAGTKPTEQLDDAIQVCKLSYSPDPTTNSETTNRESLGSYLVSELVVGFDEQDA